MTAPTGYQIERAMSAWMSARASLLTEDADLAKDEAALSAVLGSAEGDVRDILTRLLRGAKHAKSMADAADAMISDLDARRHRYKRRYDAMRSTAFAIMQELGETRFELPDLTASIAKGRPSVVITDEAAIPDEYMRVSRAPDKSALMENLKVGEIIPGAELSNSPPTLQVRSK